MREALISKQAVLHNVALIRKKTGLRKLLAFLKADAYGHGLPLIASIVDTCVDGIAVSSVSEVEVLKSQGIQTKIVLTSASITVELCEEMAQWGVDLVLYDLAHIELLQQACLPADISVWLKVNTGMNRLGVPLSAVAKALQALKAIERVSSVVLMTHCATADQPMHVNTQQQCKHFQSLSSLHDGLMCFANSAGIWTLESMWADWVRPGISLYGVSPFSDQQGSDLQLKPVMTMRAQVLAIQALKPGDSVGYGCRWTAQMSTQIAVICLGYADGVPWNIPDGASVMIRGRCYPLVGRVSMDLLSVDIGCNAPVIVGDWAILWGPQLPVELLARAVGTIPYELVCRVGARVKRRLID